MSKRRRNAGQRPATDKPPRQRRPRSTFVARPFEGLADEPEWVALRELVPAATAPLTLAPSLVEQYGERTVTLATLLPMASPALARPDGKILVGLQRQVDAGVDANRDVAAALLAALDTDPGRAGRAVDVPTEPGEGPRLADVLADGPLDITMHDGFGFWTEDDDPDPEVTASLERANESVLPTVRMPGARAAYWCQVAERAHLRWVLAEPEDTALNALARLRAAGTLTLGEDTRFAGMFRAHGLLVPVWDLPREPASDHWEEAFAALTKRYAEALGADGPLDAAARRARQGLIGRQLTLR